MKTQHVSSLICAFWMAVVLPAGAITLYWDAGITGATGGGATANESTEWKTSGAGNVWWDGSANVAWANGNDATFAGTAGNVRLGGNNATISLGTLTFSVTGYTIDLRDFTDNTANNLTVTGIGGSTATINNTSGADRTLTIDNAADQTWNGTITSQRIKLIKKGTGKLSFGGTLPGAYGGTSVDVQAGTLKLTSAMTTTHRTMVNAANGGTFDLGGCNLTVQGIISASGGVITNSSATQATFSCNYGGTQLPNNGIIGGNVRFLLRDNNVLTLAGNNTFDGGVTLNNGDLYNTTATAITVTHDNGLGIGPVDLSAKKGTLNLNLRSAAPQVGSLAGGAAGGPTATKYVNLGNTGVDTTATIGALGTSTAFDGSIRDFSGRTGSITKIGAGTLTLSGANTYTGTTRVENGTLRVTHATSGLAACKVQVAGGTFAGPESSGTGVVKFNLGATPDSGIVMTSGELNLLRVGLDFVGTATLDSYTLVDYSAGGTFVGATNMETANSFASATNVPEGYKWSHDTVGKRITLFLPPKGTVILIK